MLQLSPMIFSLFFCQDKNQRKIENRSRQQSFLHRIGYSRQKSKKNDATIASINTNIARIFPKMDSRIFCRFVQGVWHSVRGSQREKLLPKNRIAPLHEKPSRSNGSARLFCFWQKIRDFQAIILSFVVDFRKSQKEACL